ncbi:MAG: hypothetical protein U5Q44_09135 [Dehalococcoidia bacterium]|nr:hypothetical protein [Dehalococcoidia bacterium]
MAQRQEEPFRPSVAFVTHTRDYRSAELLPALARNGYTTTERPHDRETERLIQQFEPDMVVLCIDPRNVADVDLVGAVARGTNASILVLAPGPNTHGMANALYAGADVCVRDTDGAEVLAAQVAALGRRRGSESPARPRKTDATASSRSGT